MRAVNAAQLKLEESGIQMARLEAEMLAAHVLQCERHHIYLNRDLLMSREQIRTYFKMVEERRLGKPIQYIIGSREFMGLDFKVDKNVLIPRCDTETLVESALEKFSPDKEVLIADIGTGSGAIAVSLAYYVKNARILGIDSNEEALRIAEQNAKMHGVEDRIEFLRSDMFAELRDKYEGTLDAIISNPPYIPTKEIDKLAVQVREYEPRSALDGGEDGLDFYRQIASEGYLYLKEEGFMALEVGYNQAPLVCNILQEVGPYVAISCVKDLSGIERVVIAHILNGKKG